ncbi:MAG: hypothetical protein U9Q62_10975 [Campylobacterota bacterium]|nr:hypothetical protein [Campylobacterota bacterium]
MVNACGECHLNTFAKTEGKHTKEHFPCPSDKVTCADCHMPYIVKTGGTHSIRSHAFKIIPPEATREYDMPNSCQNGSCHQDKSVEWADQQFRSFYKQPDPKTLADHLSSKKP